MCYDARMMIADVHKTAQVVDPIRVTVADTDGYCDDSVVNFAMMHVNESRSSLFSWSVSENTDDKTRTVFLYRD